MGRELKRDGGREDRKSCTNGYLSKGGRGDGWDYGGRREKGMEEN